MRETINVLWLDDLSDSDFALKKMKGSVEHILNLKGYKSNINSCQSFDEAIKKLELSSRYDFFISDYNLDNDNDGLEYLEKIRNKKGYKQFVILYSNNDTSVIKQKVTNFLQQTNMDIFLNFTFFSSNGNVENEFSRAIDVILCRWDEINDLRGLCMSLNAELEHMLKERLDFKDKATYRELISQCLRDKVHNNKKSDMKKLFGKWNELADERNALAHVTESFDEEKGYYLIGEGYNGEKFTLYESDIDKYRVNLMRDVHDIKAFLCKISPKR